MADSAHLCRRQASSLLQRQHDRRGGFFAFAHKYACLWRCQMDAGGFYRVNRFDRAGKVGFARTAQRFTFDRAA